MTTLRISNLRAVFFRSPTPDAAGFACTGDSPQNVAATRVLSNQMIEAMDAEIGNLLVQSGLATMDRAGRLQYDPAARTRW